MTEPPNVTETPRIVLQQGSTATARTGQRVQVQVTPWPVGYVKIWAPDAVVLPDTLVLTGTDDATGREVYRLDMGTIQSVLFERSESGFATWALWFPSTVNRSDTRSERDHIAEHALLFSQTTSYSLIHRPSGTERGETTLLAGKRWYEIFKSGGAVERETSRGTVGGLPSPAEDAARCQMVSLIATRFFGGDRLFRREESVAAIDRKHVWPLGDEAAHYSVVERLAADDGDSDQTPPEPLPAAFAGAKPWLSLFAAADPRVAGPVQGAMDADNDSSSAEAERRSWRVDNESVSPVLVSTWEVQPDGTYCHAAFGDTHDPSDTPDVVGDPVPYILIPTSLVDEGSHTVQAHAFFAPPTRGRVDAMLGGPLRSTRAGEAVGDALVPFALAANGDVYVTESPHVRWDGAEGVWKAYLPDPFRLPAALSRRAYEAMERLERWSAAASAAMANVGLVATTCYDTDHRRTHLAEALGEAGDFDAAAAWGADGASRPRRLDQFQLGLRKQQAHLKERVREAVAELDQWSGGGLARGLACDLLALGRPDGDAAAAAGAEVLVGAFAASCDGGGNGNGVMAVASEVAARITVARGLTALDAAVATLDEEEPWNDLLKSDGFKVTWKVVKKSASKVVERYFAVTGQSMGAMVVLVRGRLGVAGFQEAAVVNALVALRLSRQIPVGEALVDLGDGATVHAMPGAPAPSVRVGPLVIRDVEVGIGGALGASEPVSPGAVVPSTRSPSVRAASPASFTYFEIRGSMAIDVGASAVNFTAGVFDLANAALAAHALVRHVGDEGDVGVGQAATALKAASDLMRAWDKLMIPAGRAGKMLIKVGPYAEGFLGMIEVVEAYQHVNARGAQDLADPDEISMFGGVLLVAGAGLGVAAAATTAPVWSAGWLLLVGASILSSIAGTVVLIWRENALAAFDYDTDPLTPWLEGRRSDTGSPLGSLWGRVRAPSSRALALALPGWTPDAASDAQVQREFGAQTQGFVAHAFTFPVDSVVLPDGGLAFRITPDYVPPRGTLLLSVDVTYEDLYLESGTVNVRAVIDYERWGDGFRYRVGASGSPRRVDPVPADPGWPVARDNTYVATSVVLPPTWAASSVGHASRVAGRDGERHQLTVRLATTARTEPDEVYAVGAAALTLGTSVSAVGSAFFRPLAPEDRAVPSPAAQPPDAAAQPLNGTRDPVGFRLAPFMHPAPAPPTIGPSRQ